MLYTKEQARAEIAKLVQTFKSSEARLQIEAEAQIENNYIRPLFRYLNWNTENTGLPVAEYEFVLQRTDRRGKRPDYILQLDGHFLLVMDAKQVKYDMHDPRWMNQVYAYAYSTQNLSLPRKIDFAILTDFQEFVVLDCTLYAGDPKAIANFRIIDWQCDDYVTQFDTLWELFERENMRQAARTRGTATPQGLWARYLSPKTVKANRIPPDKAFLAEMDDDQDGWRVRLAKDMKKRNPQADGSLITAAVQLLIDRLIFVKALSDREIEDDYLAQLAETVERDGLTESDTGWFTACRAIFDKLNQFYDGSIFEPRPELEAMNVSNKVVREVLRALQPENSPYNFAVLPVEILGTIYERFLGRVVTATEKRVRIEDKPEVRKAGGVYYTPQYVVDYIVQHTVGKLLESCQMPEDVTRLKILDPACGSGSFLLGAYQALIDWHGSYYGRNGMQTKRDRAAAYYDSDGRVRLTAKLKRQILLNNLCGVDIDPQAVEVTRFSLSLKALEDTRQAELYEERDLFKQTVLPNLRDNIQCGNSLIGSDYFIEQLLPDREELQRVNPFDWQTEFSTVMRAGGFDAIIGNPPYVNIEHIHRRDREHYIATYGEDGKLGKRYDIYQVFILKGLQLLKPKGLLAFITPNTFLMGHSYWVLRKRLFEQTAMVECVDLPQGVFQGVTVDNVILFLQKENDETLRLANQIKIHKLAPKSEKSRVTTQDWDEVFEMAQRELSRADDFKINIHSNPWQNVLFEKIEKGQLKLGDITESSQGIILYKTAKDAERAEFTGTKAKRGWKKLLRGKNIGRYEMKWAGEYVSYGRWLWSPRDEKFFSNPKILLQAMRNKSLQRRLVATLDTEQHYNAHNLATIIARSELQYDLRYLLGLFNSALLNYWYKAHFPNVNINPNDFRQLPIHPINFSNPADKARHDKLVQLVEAMLALHKHQAAAQTQMAQEQIQRQIAATDRQIDALVFELYGLTQEEIAVVEGQG